MPVLDSVRARELQSLSAVAAKENRAKIALTLKVVETSNWEEQERVRVREHIARLNADLETAPNAVEKLRLCQALSKLYEVAGLPKAGAYRPTESKKTRPVPSEPLD